MLYSQEVIEEVRLQNDIVDVISEYVPLKQKGTSYFGICPFHNEKTPSFSVSSEKQFFYCFGCGAAGNVYSFVMQMEHDSFPEAVRRLADRAHIILPEPEYSQQAKETEALRQRLLEMHRMAGRFYYEKLHQPEGAVARDYLQKRQMQERIQKKFGIGYAPRESTALCKQLQKQGFSAEELLKGGLALQEKEGTGIYDRFRNRLMFPILDVQGRVIGFGGRLLKQGEPKYLNSPETMLFHKSRNLYGLNFAKSARKTEIILVEGYMDMISVYQGGFHNVAAALGTAFNQEHAKVLKKYVSSVILLYDSDEAGTTAALHAIPILVENGFRVKVLQVPDGKDPDEYIKQNGAEAFSRLLITAMPYIAFEIRCLQKQYALEDTEQKVQFTTEAAKLLAKLENDIERNVYITEVAKMTGIAEDAIQNEISKIKQREENAFLQQAAEQKQTVYTQKQIGQPTAAKGILQAQRDILYLCATRRQVYEKLQKVLKTEEFLEPVYGNAYRQMGELYEKSDTVFPAELINYFSLPEEQKQVAEIFAVTISYETPKDMEKALNEELRLLKKAAVDKQIAQAAQAGFFEQMQALMENKRMADGLYITISDG